MKSRTTDLDPATEKTYKLVLETINSAKIPYLIGGGIAFNFYTNYPRGFNDLDIFCKAGDYPKILKLLSDKGFDVTVRDEKWLAKASKAGASVDFLFSAPNNVQTVDDSWLENGKKGELFGLKTFYLGAEELLWSKIYVQNATKFDGPDVNHLMLRVGKTLNWKSILMRMEADWEILLAAIINYRFVFPSKRDQVPEWLLTELIERLQRQRELPIPHDAICRGPLLSRTNYLYDVTEGGFIV